MTMKITNISIEVQIREIKDAIATELANNCNGYHDTNYCPIKTLAPNLDCPFQAINFDGEICKFIVKEMWLEALE